MPEEKRVPVKGLAPDHCPNEKPLRPDWPALVAAKQKRKAQDLALASQTPAPVAAAGPVSPQLVAKQQAFVNAVSSEMARLWKLPAEEREREYARIKTAHLGE